MQNRKKKTNSATTAVVLEGHTLFFFWARLVLLNHHKENKRIKDNRDRINVWLWLKLLQLFLLFTMSKPIGLAYFYIIRGFPL